MRINDPSVTEWDVPKFWQKFNKNSKLYTVIESLDLLFFIPFTGKNKKKDSNKSNWMVLYCPLLRRFKVIISIDNHSIILPS